MGGISLHARRIVTVAALAGALTAAPAVSAAPAASSAAIAARPSSTGASRARQVPPQRLSQEQLLGLRATPDPRALRSSVALVIDQDTGEVLFSKNETAVLPIASITKLMTALIVTEADQPLDQVLTITQQDVDTLKGTHFAAARRHPSVARRAAAPRADGLREPRRARAGPQLPGRCAGFRRGDEPQGG